MRVATGPTTMVRKLEDHEVYLKSDNEEIARDDLRGMGCASGTNELSTMQRLTEIGFTMENSLNAMKEFYKEYMLITLQDHQVCFGIKWMFKH